VKKGDGEKTGWRDDLMVEFGLHTTMGARNPGCGHHCW